MLENHENEGPLPAHERTFDKVSQESPGPAPATTLMARLFFLSKFALLANQIRLNRRDVFHC